MDTTARGPCQPGFGDRQFQAVRGTAWPHCQPRPAAGVSLWECGGLACPERSRRAAFYSSSSAHRHRIITRALLIRLKCRACTPFGFAQGRLCTRNVLNVHHAPFGRSGSFRPNVAQVPHFCARPFGDLTHSGSIVLKGFNPDSCALAIRLIPAQSCSKRSPFPHVPATPFPSLCGIRPPVGLPHNDGLAIRAVPGPFSPLCGIRPPIGVPHNEPIGDPGGSRPFLPLWITSAPLGLIHNERIGDPGGSRPFPCAPRSPL